MSIETEEPRVGGRHFGRTLGMLRALVAMDRPKMQKGLDEERVEAAMAAAGDEALREFHKGDLTIRVTEREFIGRAEELICKSSGAQAVEVTDDAGNLKTVFGRTFSRPSLPPDESEGDFAHEHAGRAHKLWANVRREQVKATLRALLFAAGRTVKTKLTPQIATSCRDNCRDRRPA